MPPRAGSGIQTGSAAVHASRGSTWEQSTTRRQACLFSACVATVRGTYGTAKAGTRTQYVQYVGPWGREALRLQYVHNAGGWYAWPVCTLRRPQAVLVNSIFCIATHVAAGDEGVERSRINGQRVRQGTLCWDDH